MRSSFVTWPLSGGSRGLDQSPLSPIRALGRRIDSGGFGRVVALPRFKTLSILFFYFFWLVPPCLVGGFGGSHSDLLVVTVRTDTFFDFSVSFETVNGVGLGFGVLPHV